MEVPEIYDDTVVIKSAVREPGDRAKIAVTSNEKDVDPVGACVGMKGSRVQSIIKELRGEKIDIIEWSDEPSVFAANALSPAKVSQVRITDINNRKMEVIVGEDQLESCDRQEGTERSARDAACRLGHQDRQRRAAEAGDRQADGQDDGFGRSRADHRARGRYADAGRDAWPKKASRMSKHLPRRSVDDLVDFLDVSLDEAESNQRRREAIVAGHECRDRRRRLKQVSGSRRNSRRTKPLKPDRRR